MANTTNTATGTASTEGVSPTGTGSGTSEPTGTGTVPDPKPGQVGRTAPLDSSGSPEGKTSTGPDSGAPGDDLELDGSGNPKNKEAAKWRVKAREAESERDSLRSTIDSLRTEVLESKLPAGIKAKAVLSVVEMSDLLTDGAFDSAKIAEAVSTAREELGIRRSAPGSSSLDRADSGAAAKPQHTWNEALSRR